MNLIRQPSHPHLLFAMSLLDTLRQAAQIVLNLIQYAALQVGYELDTTTIASTIVSLIALYFTLVTIYRTATYAIRTAFWVAKWCLILYVIGGCAGFVMSGGQKGFTLVPVFELLFAYALKLVGWGGLPQVALQPDGIRVNGIPVELPNDYHQYGDAFRKFKSRSAKPKPRKGIFDRFNSKKTKQPDNAAAAFAQRILGDTFDFDAVDAMQSVEAIQKGVADSLEAVKKALSGETPEPEKTGGWANWWPFQGESTNESGSKAGSSSR